VTSLATPPRTGARSVFKDFPRDLKQKLRKLARRNPKFAEAIVSKIVWLAENADEIGHRPIKGREFYSLHSGPYRIPYLLDKSGELIIIDDIAKHDAAYDRIDKL
jgi:mRNA-degrading endonuclease RelE of RelBE toxin-antitoxin system